MLIQPAVSQCFGASGAQTAFATRMAPSLLARPGLDTSLAVDRMSFSPLCGSLRSPFVIATDKSKLFSFENVLVTLEAEGAKGLGEAAPYFGISGDTPDSVREDLKKVAPEIEGARLDLFSLEQISARLMLFPSSRAALEIAFLDALARKQGLPLFQLLSPGEAKRLPPTDVTIPIVSTAEAITQAGRYCRAGFKRIKLKVGDDPALSEARAFAIETAFEHAGDGGQLELLIDANGAYSAAEAIDLMERLAGRGVKFAIFEQPVDRADLAGMAEVTEAAHSLGALVFADESVYSAEDLNLVADSHAADGVNLKLMKHGGLVEALRVAEAARARRLKVMVGGMVETRLAMTAALSLAVAIGDVHWLDLDTPLLVEERFLSGGIIYDGPWVYPPVARGLGVELR